MFNFNLSVKIYRSIVIMVIVYISCIFIGITQFSIEGIKACLMLTTDFWFIKAYIGLFLLAPFLNTFIDGATNKQLISFLVAFYIFQSMYGWFVNAAEFIQGGYSTFSFVGLYVLARTSKLNVHKLAEYHTWKYILIYLVIILMITTIAIGGVYWGIPALTSIIYAYSCPLVIISSMCLVYIFSRLSLQSSIINWIAVSSLSVYLIHMHFYVKRYFRLAICNIYETPSYLQIHIHPFLMILLFCMLVFLVSVFIDKLRVICWNTILKQINKK